MIRAALLAIALFLASHGVQAQTIGGATPLPQPVQPSDKIFIFRNGAPVNSTTVATLLSGLTTGVFGPQSSTNAYVPQWNGVAGNSLTPGLPVNTTGPSTIVQTLPSGLLSPSIMPAAPSPGSGNMIAPVTPGTVGNLVAWNGGTATNDSGLGVVATISSVPGGIANAVPGLSTPGGIGFQRTTPTATDIEDVLIRRDAEFSGGTPEFVNTALQVATHVRAGITSDEFGALFFLDNYATTTDAAENNAAYFRSIKETTGKTWAATFEADDKNTSTSSTGAPVSVEMDLYSNGPDLGANRTILDLVAANLPIANGGTGAAGAVTYGLRITTGDTSTIKFPIDEASMTCASGGQWFNSLNFQVGCAGSALGAGDLKVTDGTVDERLLPLAAGSVGIVGTYSNHDFTIYANGTEVARALKGGGFEVGPYPNTTLGVGQIRATDGTVDLRMLPLSASSAGIVGTFSNHDLVLVSDDVERMRLPAAGGVELGPTVSSDPTLAVGEVSLDKISASGSAPGAGYLKFAATAGTNSGSCKVIAYAGTSATPVTVVDNVGGGC